MDAFIKRRSPDKTVCSGASHWLKYSRQVVHCCNNYVSYYNGLNYAISIEVRVL